MQIFPRISYFPLFSTQAFFPFWMPAVPRVDRLKNVYSSAKALNFGFRLSATNPQAVLHNGVSAYQPQLHRVTIHFCKKSESSVGVRNFIEHSLTQFATENPCSAIYVMPGCNCTPYLRGEYSNGREIQIKATNFSMEEVSLHMNNLRTRSGLPIFKFENPQFSHHKSVQGMWMPTTWQDSMQNVHSCGSLPKPAFSTCSSELIGASEYLLQEANSHQSNS